MKNKRYLALLTVFFFGISSFQQKRIYEQKALATVRITFNNTVSGKKIVLGDSTYMNPFGEKYTVRKFKYYVSNLSFKKGGPGFILKNFYQLVDESSADSKSFLVSIPEGSYTGIGFLLGVDSLHNVSGAQSGALDPAKDMFWTWNSGYVMAKLEGNSPASTLVNHKYEFHIGGYSGKYNVLKNIVLDFPKNSAVIFSSKKITEVIINADVDAWWHHPHDIKIAERANIMTPGEWALAISDNYAHMFHIENIIEE